MTESKSRSGEATGTQAAHPEETAGASKQRRSGRLSLEVPIVIIGADQEGRVFSEETHTVVVSLHGAGIVSRHRLMAEQELILRAVGSTEEVEVRVVGEIGNQAGMYTYGVAFVDEELEYWNVEFPVARAWEQRPLVLALECTGRKGVVSVTNGDFEYDICTIHGGLARFCNECGLLTVWKRSQEAMPLMSKAAESATKAEVREASAAVPEAEGGRKAVEVVALAEAMEGTERRTRVRAKVNFHACVRTEAFGEEIVKCIDMSRGGVSFRSRNAYKKDMRLMIAVPFSPETKDGPAIFVQGRVANTKDMGSEGMWRYGVEFVR